MHHEATTSHFEHTKAKRERVPLLLALYGPSGGGKTKSALRLADGIRRVSGGKVFMIDTEARRGLHYAEDHDFEHLPLVAPFGPLRYLAAIEHCIAHGASTVIVDSMSHEHEGPGGVLEMHAAEVERMCDNAARKGREANPEAYKMLAWQKPKSERRRMINTILQMPINFIFCFRAKEKLLIERGKDPKPRGFMPITGEEFVYEMTATALLLPCADGVPTWQSNEIGEQMMIKRPAQFRPVLDAHRGKPLCEDIGEAMARWAAGNAAAPRDEMTADFEAATRETLPEVAKRWGAVHPKGSKTRGRFAALYDTAEKRVNPRPPTKPPSDPGRPAPPPDPEDYDRSA